MSSKQPNRIVDLDGTFGPRWDVEVPDGCDVIIMGTLEDQFVPRRIGLPHHAYVATLAEMLAAHPRATGVAVYPARADVATMFTRKEIEASAKLVAKPEPRP